MEINSNTAITYNAIFDSLDMKDGKGDNKIQASIWNKFADQVGGKHIKYYIEYGNAIKSIEYYMKKGGEAVKKAICEFCGISTDEAQKNLSEADALLKDAASGKLEAEISEGSDDDGQKYKYAKLPDGRWITAHYNEYGDLARILVSVDTNTRKHNNRHGGRSENYDSAEVMFCLINAYVEGESRNESNHNCIFEFEVTEGYEFKKYEALAEKIFGTNK